MIKIDAPLVLTVTALLAIGIPYLLWKIPAIGKWIPLPVLQILAGLLLGPSILGPIIGMENHKAFFGANIGAINAVAVIAVILFAFLAGVGTDVEAVKKSGGTTVVTGFVSLLAPLLIGAVVAIGIVQIYPTAKAPNAGLIPYALGFGLVMSITALPVLAAILNEFRIMSKPISSVALAGAGIGNAFIWVGLGIVLVLNQAATGGGGGGGIGAALAFAAAGAGAILAIWFVIGRPLLNAVAAEPRNLGTILTIAAVLAFVSGGIAHVTKLHFILGAFIGGLLVPLQHRRTLLDMLERPVNLVFVPFFFVVAGLATVIDPSDPSLFVIAFLGLLVAIFSKIVPTAYAAKASGETMAFGAALGIMHMTKGLVGVALANALLVGGVFGDSTYTAMVFISILCTAGTAPFLIAAAAKSAAIKAEITPSAAATPPPPGAPATKPMPA